MDEVTTQTSKTTTTAGDDVLRESKSRWAKFRDGIPTSQRMAALIVIAIVLFVFIVSAALVAVRQNDMTPLKEVGTFPVVILLVGGFLTLLGVKDPE